MKYSLSFVVFGLFLALKPVDLPAATIIIDTFDEGGYDLTGEFPDSIRTNFSIIHSDLVGGRDVFPRGIGAWTMKLTPADGFTRYDVSTSVAAPIGQVLSLNYLPVAGQTINLLGQNAFLLKFSSLTGSGDLQIGINGNLLGSFELGLTSSGEVIWPYSYFPAGISLNTVNQLTFRFAAKSADFSFNLDEISLVPEPTSLTFSYLVLFGFIAKRRRL
jgi:hypothetical protein